MNKLFKLSQLPACFTLAMLTSLPLADSDSSTPALLHRVDITENALLFGVTGYGCTKAEHFFLRVESEQPLSLMVSRTQNDRCRARSRERSFSLSFDHLPASVRQQIARGEFRLANPLRALPQSVRDFKPPRKGF